MIIWKNGFYMLSQIIYQDVRKKVQGKKSREMGDKHLERWPGKLQR